MTKVGRGGSKPGRIVWVCILATGAALLATTAPASAAPPLVSETTFSEVSDGGATLEGVVNPGGENTSYRFEYVTRVVFEESEYADAVVIPAGGAAIGSGAIDVPVAERVEGLAAATEYRFRLVATNPAGSAKSADLTFATHAPAFLGLPDGRVYEQATPVEKNGGFAQGGFSFVQASSAGDAVTYFSGVGFPGGEGAQEVPMYVARRTAAGWTTEGLLPSAAAGPIATVRGWSEDLSHSYVAAATPGEPSTFYARERGGELLPIAAGDEPFSSPFSFAAATPGGSIVLFESTAQLLPNAAAGKANVYAWEKATGTLRLASVLNDGTAPVDGAFAGQYNWFFGGVTTRGGAQERHYTQAQHVLTADGGRAFFTASGSGQLYVRENPTQPQSPLDSEEACAEPSMACTTHVSASRKTNGSGTGGRDPNGPLPAAFMTSTPDGERVFFTSSEELTNDANTGPDPAIGRANLDGTGADGDFVPVRAQGLAVTATHVYWTNPGTDTIGRANLDGTGVSQSFITGADNPQGIAADGTHLYWANAASGVNGAGTIGRANLDGTGVNQAFITGANNPHGVAVNATHVFWANAGSTLATRRVGRANVDGTGVNQSFVNVTGAGNPQGVAVNATHVYWSRPSADAIGRANLDGTSPNQTLIAGAADPRGIALDGTHVFWTNHETGAIGRANLDGTGADQAFIANVAGPLSVAVDAAHIYWAANAGGPGNDLYRYDADLEQLTDLAPASEPNGADVQGVLGASDDGSHVYFAANGALASGAPQGDCGGMNQGGFFQFTGACGLYHWHDGAIEYITTLDVEGEVARTDATNWAPSAHTLPGRWESTSRVSADGLTLLFRSQRQLTAYDNEGLPQYYLYRAGADAPVCISCNPTGAPPTVDTLGESARLQSIEAFVAPQETTAVVTRNLSADGNQVFFESSEPLVSGDTNGVKDVYEWEASGSGSCGGESQNGGCLYLLSTGKSPEPSFFADAGADGSNVLFFTAEPLVGQDRDELVDIYDARVGGGLAGQNPIEPPPCTGDTCRSLPAAPGAFQDPASSSFSGPGNRRAVKKARRCGRAKRRVRRNGKVRCVPRKRRGKDARSRGRALPKAEGGAR